MLATTQWRRLEQTRTHSIYLADREVEGLTHLPLSIAVRQQVAPSGSTFAAGLRTLTTAEIVTFDTAIGPILRWEWTKPGEGELGGEAAAERLGDGVEGAEAGGGVEPEIAFGVGHIEDDVAELAG